ncbi:TPA: S24 family peptidase [Stenotrophomonas maltophilia]|nr:S24 family peptidase [Stenotrophomonas maltophilia]
MTPPTAMEAIPVGDCSADERTGAGVAYVSVKDDLNAPALEAGDVLLVDLGVTRWEYDGVYVVDVNGEPVVRFVQDRGGGGLYVYCLSLMDQGQPLSRESVSILAAVIAVTKTRRIA